MFVHRRNLKNGFELKKPTVPMSLRVNDDYVVK
jgi:hypothetical protein